MHLATCWWNPISASTKLESQCQLLGWAFGGNFAAQNMGIGHIFTLCTVLHFFVRSETPKTGGVRRTSRDRVLQAGSRPSVWRGQAISICRTLRKQSKLPIPNSREMHCFPYGPRQKRERQSKPWGHAWFEAFWQAEHTNGWPRRSFMVVQA